MVGSKVLPLVASRLLPGTSMSPCPLPAASQPSLQQGFILRRELGSTGCTLRWALQAAPRTLEVAVSPVLTPANPMASKEATSEGGRASIWERREETRVQLRTACVHLAASGSLWLVGNGAGILWLGRVVGKIPRDGWRNEKWQREMVGGRGPNAPHSPRLHTDGNEVSALPRKCKELRGNIEIPYSHFFLPTAINKMAVLSYFWLLLGS